ncbi:MAG TPA: hypothetical protein VIL36_10150, partial [Acidimicrobiales bacterium]
MDDRSESPGTHPTGPAADAAGDETGATGETGAPGEAGADAGAHSGVIDPGNSMWTTLLRDYATEPPSERRAELQRTGNALRRIVHRLHGSKAGPEDLRPVADRLEALAEALEQLPSGSLYEGFGEATLGAGDRHAFFDHSPMLGRANPLAPPIELWPDGDVMRGKATFGSAYEGPPGCVHGGYVAAAFDEVLGSAQSLGGRPGMTGRLTIHYRSPTPLGTE